MEGRREDRVGSLGHVKQGAVCGSTCALSGAVPVVGVCSLFSSFQIPSFLNLRLFLPTDGMGCIG